MRSIPSTFDSLFNTTLSLPSSPFSLRTRERDGETLKDASMAVLCPIVIVYCDGGVEGMDGVEGEGGEKEGGGHRHQGTSRQAADVGVCGVWGGGRVLEFRGRRKGGGGV